MVHATSHPKSDAEKKPSLRRKRSLFGRLIDRLRRKLSGNFEYWHSEDKSGWLLVANRFCRLSSLVAELKRTDAGRDVELLRGLWRRRWIVLKQDRLAFFETDNVDQDSLPYLHMKVNQRGIVRFFEGDILGQPFVFQFTDKPGSLTVRFAADTLQEKQQWMAAINRAIIMQSKSYIPDDQC